MKQYILKSALAVEIERLLRKYSLCTTHTDYEKGLKEGRLIGYKDVLFKVNTSETKEVDLDSEITLWANAIPEIQLDDVEKLATYFFELGLKTKGE